MNRARRTDESQKAYRASMKAEEQAIKDHLRGSYIHVSRRIIPQIDPSTGMPKMMVEHPGHTYRRPEE